MRESKTTSLFWSLLVLGFVMGMMILHVPGAAKLEAIAPLDLIYNHAPWDVDKPDDIVKGSSFLSDQFDYVHPTYAYLVESLRSGVLPVHSVLIGNGSPFFFNMTHYGANPVALGLGVIFGAAQGYTLYLLLLTCIAGLCFFHLLRSYELHPIAALWGVMVLIFSTSSLAALGIPMSDQMFFTVIIMWSVRRIFLKPDLILFFPLTLSSYLLLTSPYPPGTITAGLFLIAFTLMEMSVSIRRDRFIMKQLWIGAAALLTILVLASPFLIEAANMFLSSEGVDRASREGQYARWRLAEGAAFLGLNPFVLGEAPGVMLSTWAPRWFFDMNYFGLASAVFLFASVFCLGRYRRVSFFLTAAVFYLITIYAYKLIYAQTLGQLPLLSGVRAYAHLYMWVICVAALSAYGLQTQFSDKLSRVQKILALGIGLIGVVSLAIYLSKVHPELQETVDLQLNQSRNVLHWMPFGLLVFAFGLRVCDFLETKGSVNWDQTYVRPMMIGVFCVTCYDLLSVSSGVNRTVSKEHYFPQHPAIEQLQEVQGDAKILPLNGGLLGLAHLPYDLRSIAFRGFFNDRMKSVVREYAPNLPSDRPVSQFIYRPDSTDLTHPLVELMGVKYITDLTSSHVLDEYEARLLPRNVKDIQDLFPEEALTQYMDIPGIEKIDRFELRFLSFPDGATVKIAISRESDAQTLWSGLVDRSLLQESRLGHWVFGVEFDKLTLTDDRLVINLRDASEQLRLFTYSQRTNSDVLEIPNGQSLIGSLAVDIFSKKTENRDLYPRLRKIRSQGISIYENLDYKGRVHVTLHCVERPETEMLSAISASRPDLTQTVFREACPSTPLQDGRARIVNERPGRIGLALETSGPTILVLGDNYSSGWTAEANGTPINVFRANYNFIGVDIPEGTDRIVLRYAPMGLWPAFWIACVTWTAFMGAFFYTVLARFRPQLQEIR